MNLYQAVLQPYFHQQRKHELGDGYAEKYVNEMTNVELLEAISDVLEQHGVELK